ncbi:UNVERIFIED_CONTAM: uncharacterized protein DUF4446 [Acetivibrio alkalicellulosi]
MISFLNNLYHIIENNINLIILINSLLIFLIIIIYINLKVKFNKISKKYKEIMISTKEKNLEEVLFDIYNMSKELSLKNKEIDNKINYIERSMDKCMQKIGVVRYNAFENVGSELSFAVALLDNNNNGVVINGLYSRDSSSTYAKMIQGGKSKQALSAEEIQAIDYAIKSKSI